jgi:hypothetical protein
VEIHDISAMTIQEEHFQRVHKKLELKDYLSLCGFKVLVDSSLMTKV